MKLKDMVGVIHKVFPKIKSAGEPGLGQNFQVQKEEQDKPVTDGQVEYIRQIPKQERNITINTNEAGMKLFNDSIIKENQRQDYGFWFGSTDFYSESPPIRHELTIFASTLLTVSDKTFLNVCNNTKYNIQATEEESKKLQERYDRLQ